MVRALASHQCGPGSIPGLGVICGLSLLLVLVLVPRAFSPDTTVFPPSSKTNTSNFQFDPEAVEVRGTSWISTKIHIYQFILLNVLFIDQDANISTQRLYCYSNGLRDGGRSGLTNTPVVKGGLWVLPRL